MRRRMSSWVFYTLWIMTAVGVGGVYWIIHAQEQVTERLSSNLQAAEDAVLAGHYSDASQSLQRVTDEWGRIEKLWALHTQHEQLDPVGDALLEAEALIAQSHPAALAALRLARSRLEQLPQRDRPLLSNLL